MSQRTAWLAHEQLDVIARSGMLKDCAIVVDLKDHQRGLVWVDGRFSHILPPGLTAYWTGQREVKIEIVDARTVRFVHNDLKVITRAPQAGQLLDICTVQRSHVGVLFVDGRYVETLSPAQYAFWRGAADAKVVEIDVRETMVDIGGASIIPSHITMVARRPP